MKRALQTAAVLVAVVAVLAVFSLPPAELALDGREGRAVPGVVHVHTNRSDGRGSPDEVAAAAARAGLAFLIFTDHGDGTRAPDPPVYRSGVLCLDGVEISTAGGHYVAIGLPAAPYPLGGEPRDVIEDVRRLGGVGIIAHPDSPKAALRWPDWTLPFDGVELVNLDTVWRQHLAAPGWALRGRLLRALLAYPLRPKEAMGNLLTVSDDNRSLYAELTSRRDVVAMASVDAHAKLALRDGDPGDNRFSLPFPGYESVFRTLHTMVRPDRPLTGDARTDADLIVSAIRAGRLHAAVASLASPAVFEFTADTPTGQVHEGGRVAAGPPFTLRVRSNAPEGFSTSIIDGAGVIATGTGQELDVPAPGTPAAYRVEIRAVEREGQPAWIVSNPIYVRAAGTPVASPTPPVAATASARLFDGATTTGWRTEHDPVSRAALDLSSTGDPLALALDYALAGAPARNQFAALVVETPGGAAPYDRLAIRLRATTPMRVSVQARIAATTSRDEHWARSVYVDETPRDVVIPFDDMMPLGQTRTPRLPAANVHSLIFAVALTNTAPGSTGTLWIEHAALETTGTTQ